MARNKGLGSVSGKTTKSLSLDPVSRSTEKRTKGIYPRGEDAGRYGSTRYATVLEMYNRDSDFARWRHGQQYYHGIGKGFAEQAVGVRVNFMLGQVPAHEEIILTAFPSKSSADFSWTAGRRVRGSVVSKVPFNRDRVTLDQNPNNPSEDRLIYRVSEEFEQDQFELKHLQLLIGDQIEDSFSGPERDDRIGNALGSVALTLLAVNAEDKTLTFDLSKPQGRIAVGNRLRWSQLPYDPGDPWLTIWRPGNHLGTSIHYYCTCPDFSATLTANTQSSSFQSSGRRFPLPSASRIVRGEYEEKMAGFAKRWRDMPIRFDQRRECKHIHCLRWQTSTPWMEPNDLPLGGGSNRLHAGADTVKDDAFAEVVRRFYRDSQLDWQNLVQCAAGVMGFNLQPLGDLSQRSSDRPTLFQLEREPEPQYCLQNDLWLERGTKNLWLFMEETGGWVNTVPGEDGEAVPIVSYLPEGRLRRLLESGE